MKAEPAAAYDAAATRSFAFERLSATATVLDQHGAIVDTNVAWRLFAELNGGETSRMDLGISYLDVCDLAAASGERDAALVAAGIRQILAGERTQFDFEYPCSSPTEERWFLLQASAAPVGGATGAVLFHVDITGARLHRSRVVRSDLDGLTSLPNRQAAIRELDCLLDPAVNHGSLSVLHVDLDGFQAINDRYGHRIGDEILVKVAVRLDGLRGDSNRVHRIGGDQFLVIAPAVDPVGLVDLRTRVHAVIAEPFQVGPVEVLVTATIGSATSGHRSTIDSLLHAAIADLRLERERARQRRGPTAPVPGV